MHEGNELLQLSINNWKAGWPSYIVFLDSDARPLISIVNKLCGAFKLDLSRPPDKLRVMTIVKNIASYCGSSRDWRDKNLYRIDQAISSVMQEMVASHKLREEQERDRQAFERVYEKDKVNRRAADLAMEEESKRLKAEHDSTWSADDESSYQAYLKRIQPGKVIGMELAKEKHINRAL